MPKLNAQMGQAESDSIAQPQMTPMIDVVFQMLIFFMVGMQIKEPEGVLKAHLPKDRGVGGPPKTDQITPPEVRIRLLKNESSGGEIDIFFEQYRCDGISDLAHKLQLLGSEMSSIPVVIDGGPQVPFSFILGTLNACVKARFTQISFKAPAPEEVAPE